jgi:hypothetical protein
VSFHVERFDTQGKPGLHALIVGISAYANLRAPNDPSLDEPPPETFGLRQVTSTALTAYRIYQWLKSPGASPEAAAGPAGVPPGGAANDAADGAVDPVAPAVPLSQLALPLASIRLLVAPSAVELAKEPGLAAVASECRLVDLQKAAKAWREDAKELKDNETFFYFAVHGVQRADSNPTILLGDFGDGLGDVLQNAVDVDSLRYGMRPTDGQRPNMARTQFYFVDACRDLPPDLKALEQRKPSAAFAVDLESGIDDRCAPVFYASVPGSQARAFPGRQTVFSEALLACLNGAAADRDKKLWAVTVFTLVAGLRARVDRLARELNAKIDYDVDKAGKNAVIVRMSAPPTVDVSVEVDPIDALQVTGVTLTRKPKGTVWELPGPPIAPHPHPGRLPAGFYDLSWRIAVPAPDHPDWLDGVDTVEVSPLKNVVSVSVGGGAL